VTHDESGKHIISASYSPFSVKPVLISAVEVFLYHMISYKHLFTIISNSLQPTLGDANC